MDAQISFLENYLPLMLYEVLTHTNNPLTIEILVYFKTLGDKVSFLFVNFVLLLK